MKLNVFISFFFALLNCPLISISQNDSIIVRTPNTEVIYSGCENPLQISLSPFKEKNISFKVSEGNLRKDSLPGHYIWQLCENKQDTVVLTIYNNGVFIKRFRYGVMKIFDPVIRPIGGFRYGCVGGSTPLRAIPGLFADYGEALIKPKATILHFSVEFKDSTGIPYQYYYNDGNLFTKAVKDELNKISDKKGHCKIYNIVVQIGCKKQTRLLSQELAYSISN